MVMTPVPVLVAVSTPPLFTMDILPVPTSVAATWPPLFSMSMKPFPATATTSAALVPVTVTLATGGVSITGKTRECSLEASITVFTIVTDAKRAKALPYKAVGAEFPAVEKVMPALAMIVPAIEPPPEPLKVAHLPVDITGLRAVYEDDAAGGSRSADRERARHLENPHRVGVSFSVESKVGTGDLESARSRLIDAGDKGEPAELASARVNAVGASSQVVESREGIGGHCRSVGKIGHASLGSVGIHVSVYRTHIEGRFRIAECRAVEAGDHGRSAGCAHVARDLGSRSRIRYAGAAAKNGE
jgi:hypothetical protein